MNRVPGTLALAILLIASLSASLFAAGVDLTGIGARATALGGNYRAVANDWSAMYWNPAGMAFTKGWHAGVSLEFIKPTVGYTPAKSLAGQQFSATDSTEKENEPKTFLVPAGGIYYSDGKFAFGLGVWAPFGLGAKWDLLNTSTYNSAYPKYEYDDDLKIIDIHPTFSYRLSDNLSVGLGASLVLANIMIQKPNFTPNPYIYNTDITQNPALKPFLTFVMPKDALTSPYDHLLTDTKLEGDGTTFGGSLGIMYKPVETLSIGLSARYYANVPLEGTVNATTYFANHAGANTALQGPKKLAFDPMYAKGELTQEEYTVLTMYYSGQSAVRAKDMKLKADLPLPMTAGAGIAFTGIRNLLIAADVAWTKWSEWDVILLKDEHGKEFGQLVENWEDGIRAGIGLEYALGFMKLRGSFYSEPRAAIPETMTPTIPDLNRRNTFNIGVELPVGPLRLHASYEKMLIDDTTVDTWVLDKDQTGYENMAGKYTSKINNFMIGLGYEF